MIPIVLATLSTLFYVVILGLIFLGLQYLLPSEDIKQSAINVMGLVIIIKTWKYYYIKAKNDPDLIKFKI